MPWLLLVWERSIQSFPKHLWLLPVAENSFQFPDTFPPSLSAPSSVNPSINLSQRPNQPINVPYLIGLHRITQGVHLMSRFPVKFPLRLEISTSVFNVIRFILFSVILASLYHFLLDWMISEGRIRALVNGKDVRFGGSSYRFMRNSTSGFHGRWMLLLIVALLYGAELAIEFGSGSIVDRTPIFDKTLVLQKIPLSDAPKCQTNATNNAAVPCFRYETVQSAMLLNVLRFQGMKYMRDTRNFRYQNLVLSRIRSYVQ